MKISFRATLLGVIALLVADSLHGESYYAKPLGFVGVVSQLGKVIDEMAFISTSLKDVNDGKAPPARSPTWQTVITDAEALASSIHNANFITHQHGDMSAAAQLDCARYEGVLVAYKNHYQDLQDTQKELPAILAALNGTKTKLATGADSADSLMKLYAHLSTSPVPAVRDFFAWAAFDMIKLSRALNTAKGEVEAKIAKIERSTHDLPEQIIKAKANFEAYEKRIPAMKAYCAGRH